MSEVQPNKLSKMLPVPVRAGRCRSAKQPGSSSCPAGLGAPGLAAWPRCGVRGAAAGRSFVTPQVLVEGSRRVTPLCFVFQYLMCLCISPLYIQQHIDVRLS